MKKACVNMESKASMICPKGRVNPLLLDATSEEDIALQQKHDDKEAMQDAARFARHVRTKLGMTQSEFASCLRVSLETIRNWEQGKRCPTGAAKALLRIMDKTPDTALLALQG